MGVKGCGVAGWQTMASGPEAEWQFSAALPK
jgi:hypothetical protein